ncbi:serine hydrolase FSH [Leptodontidium sp. 2 PMI_412]|nr:serine hydrolase FSH [Leptodontidium sp. 2 PMI_412]
MNLPKILCLHGEGTSSEILRIQTSTLTASIPQFSFHYLDAPFPSPPGPGVLPFFEGPYYTWVRASSLTSKSDITIVRTLLQKTIAEHTFVGVLAFSQGGLVAAGLLRDEVLGKGLRFGIFLSCTYPPFVPAAGVWCLLFVGAED